MKKLYIPIIIALMGLGISVTAQEKSRKELKGDEYTFNYSYDKAIKKYTNTKDLTIDGQRNLAEAYRKTRQNTEAKLVYAEIVTAPSGTIPEDYYNYSMLLRSSGNYSEANVQMDKFAKLKPTDLRAKNYVANKGSLSTLLKDNGEYDIVHLNFNSKDQDFGPSYYKDQIVFASTRSTVKMVKRTYNLNGLPFLDMYASKIEDGQMQTPKKFDKGLNTKLHDGPASFNKEGTFVAFTRNQVRGKSKDNIVELQIFFSTYENDKWSEAVPFAQNDHSFNMGHPSLSADGKTMYFVSNKPGGYGGTDIYKSVQNGQGEWSKAENLGDQINTEGDELFPFFEEVSGTLFFSSDGLYGLGGQDIFIAKVSNNAFSEVRNAGTPLNTRYDDITLVADGATKKGYFASNRPGGMGQDDIYSVEFLKGLDATKRIEGIAMDKNRVAVPATLISLQDENGKVLQTFTTEDDATYFFTVDSGKKFKLVGKKDNYLDGESLANTLGDQPIVKADIILLTKKETITKKIETQTNLGQIAELKNIYFDLDKSNLRADAVKELDKIIEILNDHPTMALKVSSHTDCRESKEYNLALSDKRAKTTAWYIKKRITDPTRISSKGYGKANLVNSCYCDKKVTSDCSEAEHQENRRSEFTIVKPTTVQK